MLKQPSSASRVGENTAEAIVVLGCRLRPYGVPSAALRERMMLAVRLYQAEVAPIMLLAGGFGEAEAMRELSLAAGVPEAALLLENQSRNTAENALFAAWLLGQRGISRVALVSDRAHLPRARLLFRLAGLDPTASAGVPAPSSATAALLALYEAAALPHSVIRLLYRR